MKRPDFTGPWVIGMMWGGEDDNWARVWIRSYRTESTCGREGCCEYEWFISGPVVEAGPGWVGLTNDVS